MHKYIHPLFSTTGRRVFDCDSITIMCMERDHTLWAEQSLLSSSSILLFFTVCCSGCLFFSFPRGFVHNRRMPCRTRAWLFYISARPPLFFSCVCVSTKHKRQQQQQHRHQREQKHIVWPQEIIDLNNLIWPFFVITMGIPIEKEIENYKGEN